MSDSQPIPPRQDDDPIDWGALFRRKQRPLPKPGCSWAFYIFLALLLLFLLFMYHQYTVQ